MKNLMITFLLLSCYKTTSLSYRLKGSESKIEAVKNDDVELLRMLFRKSSENDKYLLHLAVKYSSINCLNYLIDKGFSVKNLDLESKLPSFYSTNKEISQILKEATLKEEIIKAFYNNDKNITLFLLEKVSFDKIRDIKGNSLFHLCLKQNKKEFFRSLFDKYKKFLNIENKNKKTIFHLLLKDSEQNLDLIYLLIDNKADINIKDKFGVSPLQMILKSRNSNLLKNTIENKSLFSLIADKNFESFCTFSKENEFVKGFLNSNKEMILDIDLSLNENFMKDWYYFCACLLSEKVSFENYLNDKSNYKSLNILFKAILIKNFDSNYKLKFTNNVFIDENLNSREFASETILWESLDAWTVLVRDDFVPKSNLSEKNLDLKKQYFLNKILRTASEAKGINRTPIFFRKPQKNSSDPIEIDKSSAKLASYNLKKLYNFISNSEKMVEDLSFCLDLLLEGFEGCSAGALDSIEQCLIYFADNTSGFEDWLHKQVHKNRYRIIKETIQKYGCPEDASNHWILFIQRELKLISHETEDSAYSRIEMERIIGDKKEKILNDINERYNNEILSSILNELNESHKMLIKFDEDFKIGNQFDFIYNQDYKLKEEVLKAVLNYMKYIEIELKEGN